MNQYKTQEDHEENKKTDKTWSAAPPAREFPRRGVHV
jgi:hypothetical protein